MPRFHTAFLRTSATDPAAASAHSPDATAREHPESFVLDSLRCLPAIRPREHSAIATCVGVMGAETPRSTLR